MKKVTRYIEDHSLLLPNDKVLVAVSGGADSVALLDCLLTDGYQCLVAHCNFHLRGEESNRDEIFVRELCRQLKVELLVKHFQTEDYARQNKLSIEMAARELRYQWFEEVRVQAGCAAIAVAHHKNDQAETLILNLKRGTGIRGLEGMKPRNGYIIRPLLCLTKTEIEAYLTLRHLLYVEDSTNTDTRFRRNAIREQLLAYSDTEISHIAQTAELMQGYEKIINSYISEHFKFYKSATQIQISISDILNSVAPQVVLYELLKPYHFTQISPIFRSLTEQSGKRFYSDTHVLLKDRDSIIIYGRNKCEDTKINISVAIRNKNHKEIYPAADAMTAMFDGEISQHKLQLRHWRDGDWFCPIGMKGKRKLLSDFFTDLHLSVIEKEKIWLLCADEDIVWVIGYRIDERYKVTLNSKQVAEVEIIAPKKRKQYGIIGSPIDHSFSPAYFNSFFEANKIDAQYRAYPLSEVAQYADLTRIIEFAGLNVTSPFKEQIIPYLDQIDEVASEIGAVNTIKFANGKTIGYNTDWIGFLELLKPFIGKGKQSKQTPITAALVLGSGGACKAVCYALKKANINYKIVSRNGELKYEDITKDILLSHQLIINCTPLGMYPLVGQAPKLPYQWIDKSHIAIDLIYNPSKTEFLRRAAESGATTVNGYLMLTTQADAAWKIWENQQ